MAIVRHRRHASSRPRRALLLAAAVFSAAPVLARAADVTSRWATAASGTWDAAANWANAPALGGFPNNGNGGVATYDAVIDATGAPYSVALNTNVTVDAFTLNSPSATFNHNAATFTAGAGGINIQAGTYNLVSGTVANTTINQAGGALVVGNGRFSNVTMNGPLQLAAPGAALGVLGASTFNGAVTVGSVGTSGRLGFFGTQTISPTTYNIEGSGSYLSTEGSGTMTIPAGATVRGGNGGGIWYGFFSGGIGNAIINQGTVRADIAGTAFNLQAAVSAPFTNTGTLAATNGATLHVTAPSWSSTGTVSVSGNSTVNLGGTFTSVGTIARSGGSINLTGTWDNTGKAVTLNATTGDVRFVGGTFKGGTVNFGGGALAVPASAVGRIDGAHVNGSLTLGTSSRLGLLNGATVTGPVHVGNSAALGLFTGQTAPATTYNLDEFNGYLSVEGAGTGTVTLPAGATVRGGNNAGIWYGFITGGNEATLDNRGAITADIPARTFTVFPSGSNRFFNGGTMSAVNGASLTINAATWSNTAAGRISATNSTLSFSGNWTNAGTVTINNSTLNLGGTFTIGSVGTLHRTGGTVNVVGTWDNAGNGFSFTPATGDWVLNGGTVRGGSLNFTGGAALRFTNHGNNRFDNVTVNGPLVLDAFGARLGVLNAATFNGDVTLSGNNVALGFFGSRTLSPVTYNITGNNTYLSTETSGTFIIPAGATVRGGHAGTAGIWNNFFGGSNEGRVVNQGTIRADVGGGVFSILQSGTGTFENTGTLAATNGGRLLVDRMSGPLHTVTLNGAGSTVRVRSGTYTINQNLTGPAGTTAYFDGEWTKSATIDVGGFVVFDYDQPGANPSAMLRAQVVQGYNGGAWNGGGFNSTAAAATPGMAVGYADTSVVFPSGALFGGQQVDGDAVLIRLTRLGDANLDGTVNLADFNRLAAGFGTTSGAVWTQGDFDYNGTVNLADFNRLAANFGLSAAGAEVTPADWAALASAVPEPATLGLLPLTALAARRRRS